PRAWARRPPVNTSRATAPRRTLSHQEAGLDALRRFVAAHGHARVPDGYVEATFPLGDWLAEQRRAARAGQLDAERVSELERLGVARVRRARRGA
ncbi:MAG TPA: helicase associated domain-containing protein, partial [Acidimicrobiales bacterium]|nr:helicase associated domain-containing protein [Acidimicrobiales bacterium]